MKTKISNVDIVLFALYGLGGATKKIHTENVAWHAYTLSKDRFSWALPKFRKMGFPDKTTVRYALESAKKLKYVTGRAGKDKGGSLSEGWKLTPFGIEWIVNNEKRIAIQLSQTIPLSSDLPHHKAARFIKGIKAKRIFLIYKEHLNLDSATIYDFADLLNCSPDAPEKVVRSQFYLLKNKSALINDSELNDFIEFCERKFEDILLNGG